jgi:hypothetical protein
MRKKTQILLQAWKLITRTMRKNRDEEKKKIIWIIKINTKTIRE